jgi:hypothetical protein
MTKKHPLDRVPALRADDPGGALVLGTRATGRDRRWADHAVRGTAVALFGEVWLFFSRLNTAFLGRPTWWITLAMIAVALWWFTGLFNMGKRSVRMGPRMGRAVARSMDVWRSLPQVERDLAEPVAEKLLAAGARHDVEGVRERAELLDRVAAAAPRRPFPGHREDVEKLATWEDGAEAVHND